MFRPSCPLCVQSRVTFQADLSRSICHSCPVLIFQSYMSCPIGMAILYGCWVSVGLSKLSYKAAMFCHPALFLSWSYIPDLRWLSSPGFPVPAVLAILSSLSFPGWPVNADLSGRPVQTDLSRLPSPSCLVPDVLFVLLHSDVPSCPCWSSSGRPVLAVVGSDCRVLVFLPQLSCPGCPCPDCTVPGVLSPLFCPCCHVMSSVLCNRLYCRGCPATVVSYWWSWPSCPVLAVMF